MKIIGRILAVVSVLGLMHAVPPPARAGGPFDIGIVPGDVVLGNIANFPGHAGVFIGRWQDLPQRIQADYADVYERVLIRSRDHGLADSYLVVDSIGGRGVTLRTFAEQFTGYLPNGALGGTIKKALHWEAKTGGAVAWPSLGTDDPRRWGIVEQALRAARARVPYDGSHTQWASTAGYDDRIEWIDGIKTRTKDLGFEAMREDGLDCITLVHMAYWRGAEIDLDVSWLPIHTPDQLHATARDNGYFRAVLFEDVFIDAALLGKWEIAPRLVEMWDDDPMQLPETFTLWLGRVDDGVMTIDQQGGDPASGAGQVMPFPGTLVRSASDTLTFESGNIHGNTDDGGSGFIRFEIGADGSMSGSFDGVDPPDSNGDGGGRYRFVFTGKKLRDMAVPPA